ncbi:MAG: hypothetical protein U1F33_13590 [Alphaproteobacteria bacterium]
MDKERRAQRRGMRIDDATFRRKDEHAGKAERAAHVAGGMRGTVVFTAGWIGTILGGREKLGKGGKRAVPVLDGRSLSQVDVIDGDRKPEEECEESDDTDGPTDRKYAEHLTTSKFGASTATKA